MTEQEQREKAIYKMVIDVYGHLFDTLPSYYEVVKDIRSGRYSDLAKLYDVGYRKVDKDSVFHIDISDELTKDFFQNEIEKVRKETAEKIYKEINAFADECIYEGDAFRDIATDFDFVKFFKWLDSFFKELGVEVEE